MIECEFLVQKNQFEPGIEREFEQGAKQVVKKVLDMDANVT